MTRAEAWAIHLKASRKVDEAINEGVATELGYGYTWCDACHDPVPIIEGMAFEFCPACDPTLDD